FLVEAAAGLGLAAQEVVAANQAPHPTRTNTDPPTRRRPTDDAPAAEPLANEIKVLTAVARFGTTVAQVLAKDDTGHAAVASAVPPSPPFAAARIAVDVPAAESSASEVNARAPHRGWPACSRASSSRT